MAVLGFHIVVSLIVLTLISKLGTRLSLIRLYIIRGLYRYVAPSNTELKALLPAVKEKANPRQRKRKREEEEVEGFKVPKQIGVELAVTPVLESQVQQFELFSSVHWLSLFVPLCMVVYVLSESFLYLYPSNGDVNVSVLWLLIAVAFILQVLASLTSWLYAASSKETNKVTEFLCLMAAVYFFISFVLTMKADLLFDVNILQGFDKFCENVAKLMAELGTSTDSTLKLQNPLLMYLSFSVFFSFLTAMMVFPSFRFATMYREALEVESAPIKLLMHFSFLMPLFTLFLYLKPVKMYFIGEPRNLLTDEQLNILRIYAVILTLILRMILRRPHLQGHLSLSKRSFESLQKEIGYVSNKHLQILIIRYYSYFNAAVCQYFSPILLSFFIALLLKTTGGMSWIALPSTVEITSQTATMGAFRSIFDGIVCKALWSYMLVMTTMIQFTLSLIGIVHEQYYSQ